MRRLDPKVWMALALAGGESLRAQGVGWSELKAGLREAAAKDPLDALAVTVLGGALLFWIAERDDNPDCRRYEDALVFVSTCLSVGYAKVFAVTPAGKAIATALMTIGPSLAAAALAPPKQDDEGSRARTCPRSASGRSADIVDKLDAILEELRRARSPTSP
jgi:hypothetical protein